MTVFEEVSYLAQVRRMRALAERALSRWPIDVASCHFLSHGENTTFRITTKRGRKFLLRIHRHEYHTRAEILEELQWLDRLSTETTLSVPRPFRSRRGLLLEAIVTPEVGKLRQCCVFEWVEGRFVRKSASPSQMAQITRMFRDGRTRELPRMKDALIEGYASQVGWDKHDEAILPYLVSARRLAMLGWLYSRSDNPMLKKYLSNAVVSAAKHLRKEYDL